MKTLTLVLAVILAMAVVGDSANLEMILDQLRKLAGEKTIDDASVTPINAVKTKGEGTAINSKETRLLDLGKKLDLASSKAEPEVA
ncbi:Hypp17 [Branchiostoma lanceolatum]|uniref:Hypp17 protein n=1 Tax=Branchiostoma lanceolatum TaxID=7740 RepID=A0A8J9YLM1_BRALA|nr:Hypp17 [Branchiostoma lanceolatum]